MKKYKNNEIKLLIIQNYEEGLSYREIAKRLNVSLATVHLWINRHAADSSLKVLPKSGRKRKTNKETDQLIYQTSVKDCFKPATDIRRDLNLTDVSVHTVRRRLKEFGLRSRKPAKCPFLTETHLTKRFEFAAAYRMWTINEWKNVLFSDEKIFRSCGQGNFRLWRPDKCRYDKKYFKVKDRQCPYKVNVWGCISFNSSKRNVLHRITRKTLDANYYINEILMKYLPSKDDDDRDDDDDRNDDVDDDDDKNDVYFVHDQASQHTARVTKKFLEDRKVKLIPWPAKGADINPIENVWAEMERRMAFRKAYNEEELWYIVNKTFHEIENSYFENLINSMPNRLENVIAAEGHWIKY